MASGGRRDQRRRALIAALNELRRAFTGSDNEPGWDNELMWVKTLAVLDWLYHCEEAEKTLDSSYYAARNSDPRGKSLSGLIWVRGLVVHHQAEVHKALFNRPKAETRLTMDASGIRFGSAVAVSGELVWVRLF